MDLPATETPAAGTTEVWQILNLTADTHPIHFHTEGGFLPQAVSVS
jgi:hypothetical protein